MTGASGAGDKMSALERGGLSDEIRRIEDGKVVDVVRAPAAATAESDNEDDVDLDVDDVAAGPLRRTNDDGKDGAVSSKDRRRKWWCTYRYRPILGMVPIGDRRPVGSGGDEGDDEDSAEDFLQEVVIVERPLWDLPHLKELKA